MRVVASVFPELRLHIAGLIDACAGVVSVREKKTELLGAMTLVEVSAKARAHGINAGDSVAQARATFAGLEVAMVLERDVTHALERICESLLPYAASVGYALQPLPTVFLDVTGCAHLFGGERALLARVQETSMHAGPNARVAGVACVMGDSPRLAQMLACTGFCGVATAQHLQLLPVSALRSILGDRPVAVCEQLGLRTFGDLQKLPKASLAHRLGPKAQEALTLLWGIDRTPFAVYVPHEAPEETLELEDDVQTTEPLLFVLRPLLDKLVLRVRGRGLGVLALELSLATRAGPCSVMLELPSVMTKVDDLWSVLKTRLERFVLPSPARSLRLIATAMGRQTFHSEAMFDAKPKGNFPRILAELVADLGEARVGKLDQVDTWNLSERSVLIPFQESVQRRGQALPVEPIHLVAPSCASHARPLKALRHLIRLEHVQWWKTARTQVCDVLMAWDEERLCVVKKELGQTTVFGVVD